MYVFVALIVFYIVKFSFNKFHIYWFNIIQINNNSFIITALLTQFYDDTVMLVILIVLLVINIIYAYFTHLVNLRFKNVHKVTRLLYTVSHVIIIGILGCYLYASESVSPLNLVIIAAAIFVFVFTEWINAHFTMNCIKSESRKNEDECQTSFISENIVTVYLASIMDK